MASILKVSPALSKIVGVSSLTRRQGLKKVWDYVRANNLQNPANKREIFPNTDLRAVFNQDTVKFTEVMKLMSPHFVKDPDAPKAEPTVRKPKKVKEPKEPKEPKEKKPRAPRKTKKVVKGEDELEEL